MPPRKQPRRLQKACVMRAAGMAFEACRKIEKEHGRYDNEECQAAVTKLRDHYLEHIGYALECVSMAVNSIMRVAEVESFRDARIIMDFLYHRYSNVIRAMSGRWSQGLPDVNIQFWIRKLCPDNRITVLEITACNNMILTLVGDYCKHLKSLTFEIRNGGDVTNAGLFRLVRCPELRNMRSTRGFACFSQAALARLVMRLPKLAVLDRYPNTGSLLSEIVCLKKDIQLSLIHVLEVNVQVAKVEAIVKTCPNLNYLELYKDTGRPSDGKEIKPLVDSNLKVGVMVFMHFTFPELSPLLAVKGKHLSALTIVHHWRHHYGDEVALIGAMCPCLTKLCLRYYEPSADAHGYTTWDPARAMNNVDKKDLFTNLETLEITGAIHLNACLDLVLFSAINIKRICFSSVNRPIDVYATFNKYIATNGLKEVNTLVLKDSSGCMEFTVKCAELLLTKLENLRCMNVEGYLGFPVLSCFEMFTLDAVKKNFDVQLRWKSLFLHPE